MKVKVKYAASQPEWIELDLTAEEYAQLFLHGVLSRGELIAFVQSLSDPWIIYDMHRRQWVKTNDVYSYAVLRDVHEGLTARGHNIEVHDVYQQLLKNIPIINNICEKAE